MTIDEFRKSLNAPEPDPSLSLPLAGLWWDAQGDWTRAHECAQQVDDAEGAWVHAYLHRKEGDQSNAAYCMAVPANRSAANRWTPSGCRSRRSC